MTTRDLINHTITSSLVTTELDGTGVLHLNRSTGAVLGGTTTRETYEGEVGYLLTLESTAPRALEHRVHRRIYLTALPLEESMAVNQST